MPSSSDHSRGGKAPVLKSIETKRRMRKEARPAELVSAALDVFLESGFTATRLDDIAARAGVSKGTVYLYFESKEALFEGVIRQAILPELETIRQRSEARRGSAAERLRGMLQDWVYLITETPLGRIPKLIVSDVDKFPELAEAFHQGAIAHSRALLRQVLAYGIEHGEFHIPNIDATVEALLATLWMPTIARESRAFRIDSPMPMKAYFDNLFELTIVALARKSPPQKTKRSSIRPIPKR